MDILYKSYSFFVVLRFLDEISTFRLKIFLFLFTVTQVFSQIFHQTRLLSDILLDFAVIAIKFTEFIFDLVKKTLKIDETESAREMLI